MTREISLGDFTKTCLVRKLTGNTDERLEIVDTQLPLDEISPNLLIEKYCIDKPADYKTIGHTFSGNLADKLEKYKQLTGLHMDKEISLTYVEFGKIKTEKEFILITKNSRETVKTYRELLNILESTLK